MGILAWNGLITVWLNTFKCSFSQSRWYQSISIFETSSMLLVYSEYFSGNKFSSFLRTCKDFTIMSIHPVDLWRTSVFDNILGYKLASLLKINSLIYDSFKDLNHKCRTTTTLRWLRLHLLIWENSNNEVCGRHVNKKTSVNILNFSKMII